MRRFTSILVLFLLVSAFVCPVSAAPAPAKEWTFMVFLNADNNLDSFGVKDQTEMSKVGSNDFLNIVSLIDRENGPATLNFIKKGSIQKLKDLGEVDMGDYKFFVQSVKDVVTAYPANHYAVIIWNHGSGWDKKKGPTFKGISYDDSTGNHITTAQLGLATAEIKKILGKNLDILGMDACLMQMMEVAYAVKDNVDYIAASEETEPGDGYPYDGILGALKKGMGAPDFCKVWVKAYAASYNGGTQGNSDSTQSAIECAKLPALKAALDEFSKVAISGNFAASFKDALANVQKFYLSENIDLGNLLSLLKGVEGAEFKAALAKLEAATKATILANGNTGSGMANATGLAIYFPEASYAFSNEYFKLEFAKDCMWDEMVQDFYKKNTAATIIADVEKGDVSSLMNYVQNVSTPEITFYLINKLNFRVFSEGGIDASTQESVKNLVKELK